MPTSYKYLIRSLLAGTATEDDVLTDRDEDTGPEDEMDIAPGSNIGAEHEEQPSPTKPDRKLRKQGYDWSKDVISRENALLPVDAAGIPLLLAPAVAMPTIVEKLRNQKSEHVRHLPDV